MLQTERDLISRALDNTTCRIWRWDNTALRLTRTDYDTATSRLVNHWQATPNQAP